MFHVGRVVSGLGIGILVTACPMYLSELAPPDRRGWLVGHHAIFLVFGYMLSGWLGFACYFATEKNPSFAWRFPLCVQCLSPLVLLVTSIWIPRSPRWLLQTGRVEEAWRVLRELRRAPDDPDDLTAKEELYQVKMQIALDSQKLRAMGCTPWTAVIKKKSYRKRMVIGFLTQWGAEFAGPLVIVSVLCFTWLFLLFLFSLVFLSLCVCVCVSCIMLFYSDLLSKQQSTDLDVHRRTTIPSFYTPISGRQTTCLSSCLHYGSQQLV